MKSGRSIRTRMQLLVLLFTGLILTAVIFWSYLAARQRLEADMEARAISLADNAAKQIDAQFGLLQGVVNGMALTLEAQDLSISFDAIRRMQTRTLEKNPGIFGVCVAMEPGEEPEGWTDLAAWEYREGDRLAYVDLSGENHTHTCEDWFTLPKHLDRPVWSEPYEWEGLLMVTYSVPFYRGCGDQRRFMGVITCDFSLDWLDRMIAELPLGKNGYGLLMSRNGTYISHPQPEIVLNETVFSIAEAHNDTALRQIGQRMVTGEPGIVPFSSFATGEISWLAYTSLQSADWIMAALISREEMHSAIVQLSQKQAAIGFAGMLLLCLAVGLIARTITRPIRDLRDAAETLAAGNLDAPLPSPRGQDEVAALTHRFGEMRENLKRHIIDLAETTAARERMHSELRIAHDIQMGLVPKTFPPLPMRNDLDLFAVIEPAREVGGDFYDFFLLDDKRMVVAIGDVSGKGVPAALFMAVTRSFLRSAFRSDADPSVVMSHVNNELVDGNDTCMFVTLFCAVFDLKDGSLKYANAGHNPPVIQHPDGHQEWITQPFGTVAGIIEDGEYTTGVTTLPDGAVLVLYTDGVTEAMNPDNALYKESRLAAQLAESGSTGSCRTITEDLVNDIRTFTAGAEQSDDITILMLKRFITESHANRESQTPCHHFSFVNQKEALEQAMEESDIFLEEHEASQKLAYYVRLAFEELVTNIIKYGYDDKEPHTIEVMLELAQPAVMTITDDGHPFNPLTDAPKPTLEGEVEDRPIGGLGLHMVQKMGMKLEYSREQDRNILRVVFPQSSRQNSAT